MPDPARVVTTDAEIDAAIERGRKYAKYDRRVVKATYSKPSDNLRLSSRMARLTRFRVAEFKVWRGPRKRI